MLHSTRNFIFLAALVFASAASAQDSDSKPYFWDPAISPDGKEIAFISGGDIWTVPSTGGEARILVSNPATESRPLYSPDGRYIAFHSTRSGNGDIYVLNMASGELSRLTYDDGNDELNAWSRDGQYVYFSSTSRDIAGMRDVFRVRTTGGTPMPVTENRYVNEFSPAPSPDGKTLAFAARGFGSHQWWRKGHSHLDESEIWLMRDNGSYEMISARGARQLWPMWSNDGKTLYYVSDRNGEQNLWMHPLNGTAKPVTNFKGGRVLWPAMSANGNSIVFERDFGIWHYDMNNGNVRQVPITLRGVAASPSIERVRLNAGFTNLALSPDGKKIAFIARGELFVAPAKEGGEAVRVTTTVAREAQPVWLPNSRSLLYVSERNGKANIYQYDFVTNKETRLTNGSDDDGGLSLSRDGKQVAFVRGIKDLMVLDLATQRESLITRGYFSRPPFPSAGISWSPDGKWLALGGYGLKSLRNVYIVSSKGGEARPASFLGNTFGGNVLWTKDGKGILFTTGQRTENSNVARIDLVPRQPRFREDQFRDLFVEPSTPANNPATRPPAAKTEGVIDSMSRDVTKAKREDIVWEGIRNRLSLLPLGVDVNDIEISPDGNTLLVSANIGGQSNLYTYTLDELSREPATLKQITFTPNFKSDMQFSSDGKEVYYLEGGRIQSVSVDARTTKSIAVTAEMDVDFNNEKAELFNQAWELQNKGFYDENFHGVNWASIKKTYQPLASGARTGDELRRILNLMVGELNASHSGVSGPNPASFNTGRTGLRFDRETYERDGKLKITEVARLSPADLSGSIQPGDYLLAVDGTAITKETNLDKLLENKTGRRVVLSIGSGSGSAREVVIKPTNLGTEKGLLYNQWVQQNREYVSRISGGRLGYVHMFDMGQESLDQLYLDIDAENHSREGVVVDIRNNNGGFVNAYALDVLSRRGYMTMTVRGLPPAPARVQLGQRSLDAPTILITNQHSLSDAEDFSEGYRTLGLGKIVGEPTAGWIIYTSNIPLMDGTSVRLPFIKITDNKGKNMELEPRPVDIPVTNPVGEKGKDTQLDVAVKELLKQLEKK